MTELAQPLSLIRGPAWKNRFMLAPLTNLQSHADGTLSDDEFNWLTYRATGGFGLVMTCAAHVQRVGQGFPGQLGIFSDDHLPGLTRLAARIKAEGAVSSAQLHHAGIRSPEALTGEPARGPSADAETGARALSGAEVEDLIEDFIAAAVRAEKAGFDGVELHGARARIVFEIIKGVRARTRPDFQLGLRLSPERFGLRIAEQIEVARQVLASGDLDYLDMSLWDVFKAPVEEEFAQRPLIDWFAELPRGETRLGAAGKLMSGADCRRILEHGADFAILGRAAVLHHDFPQKVAADPDFHTISLPVTRDYLRNERLGPAMVEYMNGWRGFVAQEEPAEATA